MPGNSNSFNKNSDLLNIDRQILIIDKTICRHIDNSSCFPRGAVSQDILSQLRNYIEHIMLKFYADGKDIENSYQNICDAIDYVSTRGDLKVLRRFHDYLQAVASHYTLDEDSSERLMLKYYEFLLRIKNLLNDRFSLNVLSNLANFPLNTDRTLQEYYEKISEKIKRYHAKPVDRTEKYYIQKIKPFFVDQRIFYEVSFTPANDHSSKSNRIIAFTGLEISDNYAVKLSLVRDRIKILGKTMPVDIIVGWEVSIRDCEYKNFTSLIRGNRAVTGRSEQQGITQFLTATGFNLSELVAFPDDIFQRIRKQVTQRAKSIVFFNDLEQCRRIIKADNAAANLLRYLLYHMNNKVIKNQWCGIKNNKLSQLYVQNGSIPFDSMPYINSPIGHNPRLRDIFSCIPFEAHKHEIIARFVRNNIEIKGQLFTSLDDMSGFKDLSKLIKTYNKGLWFGHREDSKLVVENGQIFINGYKNDTCFIIEELKKLASAGIRNYSRSASAWLSSSNHGVDCMEKKEALVHMFDSSRVALVYGSAGTGKSTLINHVAHFFAGKRKLFLAQTHPAVDNLKRRVTASKCTFSTIARFNKQRDIETDYDLIIIDECSTVSNRDMRDILSRATYKLLVLVGDTFQIASIRFGNWFSAARAFIPLTSVFELTKPYRSDNEGLLTLWKRVREMDDTIIELISRENYSARLDSSIFAPAESDEIILCLNYDGLYGINNINRFLQESNPNIEVEWGIQRYKINDPILFNETDRFGTVIYNNMKGRINRIEILDAETYLERIQFDIELDIVINEMDAFGEDFDLLDYSDNGNSIIRFCVNKNKSTDEDDDISSKDVIPFQVAYAVSIHKAQGLEYSSVKIVITDEVDELITHNIFYTAITRAQKKLKIYWTPEVEQKVLSSIKPRDIRKDIHLLKRYVNS